MRRGELSFDAYASVFADARFFSSFGYSLGIGVFTILLGIVVVVPAVYYVRLRMPWLRPFIEFITLLPLVIPALVLVYGYIRLYNSSSLVPFTGSALGTDILLTCAYVTLALPYMYRAVDTGMRSIDIGTLTEAAQILGASQLTDHCARGVPQHHGGGALGRLPDPRHRHRRIHHREPAQPAGLRPLPRDHRHQPRLRALGARHHLAASSPGAPWA